MALINQEQNLTLFLNFFVPTIDNVDKKISENTRKYQDVHQLRQLYRLNLMQVYPVVISSNGLIPNNSIHSVQQLKLLEKLLEEG